jgi:hypothetical protein
MGAVSPSKMPKAKKVVRKDNPNVVKKFAKGGFMNPQSELGDDETRMARFDQMTPSEQKQVQSKKDAALVEAESQRKRPLTSRIVDKLVTAGAPFRAKRDADASSRSIQEDEKLREEKYQDAKKAAADRSGLYGTDRVLKMEKGGKVNAAGNYTKPELRKKIVSQVKAAATQGTGAGQWSARKAQLVAKKYKAKGGGYSD